MYLRKRTSALPQTLGDGVRGPIAKEHVQHWGEILRLIPMVECIHHWGCVPAVSGLKTHRPTMRAQPLTTSFLISNSKQHDKTMSFCNGKQRQINAYKREKLGFVQRRIDTFLNLGG